ncbi:MAG: chromosomal replication initiator protein DnaA [Anaerolineaceae bacterium]|nr:chromosomal replication initiator protein DnaA [Anaerolineaceae bacterium]
MEAQQAWHATIGQLQMEMPKASFDTWVKNALFVKHEGNKFIISVQNAYARDWLDSRLNTKIARLLSGALNIEQNVEFIVGQKEEKALEDTIPAEPDQKGYVSVTRSATSAFNSRYTFENFVVGASNRLAHAASLAVAESPSRAYNPLFLYGGVGLGKTHLLQAIGASVLESGLNVLYVSSEEFTNDLINSIRTHTTSAFRERYRQIDVLLIDDIQFIAGKESTQEEFFHTFNTLHGQDKQIVITSDRPPKAMLTLETRLRSRFEGGLIVDVQLPDVETRIAILKSKADRARRNVDQHIMELIAQKVQSNIRELEGALTRVLAFADLSGMPLDDKLVAIALADMLPDHENFDPESIVREVSRSFNIPIDRLISRDRSREVALPRQVAMYLIREEGNYSLPQIGKALGGRDHTTIMYGCEKVADLMERDDRLRRQVYQIREKLYGSSIVV